MNITSPGAIALFKHHNLMMKLSRRLELSGKDKAVMNLFRSFMNLCLCFGLSQGAALTTVTYATTLFGERIGSTADGIFFATSTIASLAFATLTVRSIGELKAYKLSLLLFMSYEIILWLAWGRPDGSVSLHILIFIGSMLGGYGFALHWTSQSLIFSSTAQSYAALCDFDAQSVSVSFSGIFACVYVFFEMVCKLVAGILVSISSNSHQDLSWHNFFILFTFAIFLALLNSCNVVSPDINQHDTTNASPVNISCEACHDRSNSSPSEPLLSNDHHNLFRGDSDYAADKPCASWALCLRSTLKPLLDVPQLIYTSPLLCYLMPINISFGVTAGFLFSFYYENTVAAYLGYPSVGFVSAISPAVCSLLSIPLSFTAEVLGKTFIIFVGSISLSIIGWLYLVVDNSKLGTWPTVICIQVLMGIGRAVWEGVGKAIYVDVFYGKDLSSAFSAMYMVTGLLTFVSLFVFPSLQIEVMGLLIIVPSLLMVPGYAIVRAKSIRNVYSANRPFVSEYTSDTLPEVTPSLSNKDIISPH